LPKEHFVIVPNGVPDFSAETPARDNGQIGIMFAGAVNDAKGAPILIEALGLLNRLAARCSWYAVIAGNGDLSFMQSHAEKLGVKSKVSFTGWVDSETIHRYMRMSDILVLPSETENLPVSLIEGTCAGMALVATNVGAVSEIVRNDVNGRIVQRNAVEIAQVLHQLIEDERKLVSMQKKSREMYQAQFTLEKMASGLVQAWRSCLKS
jgi:glycosyltransferase involved in cell wall biosynthesis